MKVFLILICLGTASARPQNFQFPLGPVISAVGSQLSDVIRNGQPSDVVETALGVDNADAVNNLPLADTGKNAVATGVEAGSQFLADNPGIVTSVVNTAQQNPGLVTTALGAANGVRDFLGGFFRN